MPWLWMLLARWAIEDPQAKLRIGKKINRNLLAQLADTLWQGGDTAFQERLSKGSKPPSAILLMRPIYSSQVDFQLEDAWGLYRTSGLIGRLGRAHICWKQHVEVLGLMPYDFVDLASVIYALVRSFPGQSFTRQDLSAFDSVYGPAVDRVLALLSFSLPDLKLMLQREFQPKGNRSRELYAFPVFKHAPLVRTRDGKYTLWHPAVMVRCLDELAHLRLSTRGSEYTQPFSKAYEKYVLDLATRLNRPMLTDEQFQKVYGGAVSRKNVEAVIEFDNCSLLVEAKMGLFDEDDILQETELGAKHKLRNVLKGVSQGRSVSHRLAELSAVHRAQDHCHYLFVVTSRDLHIGTGQMLAELCGTSDLEPPSDGMDHRLPINHIFVLPIGQYELLIEYAAAGDIDLPTLLKRVAFQCRSLDGSRYRFVEFYADELKSKAPSRTPEFIGGELDSAQKRLSRIVEPQ